MRLYAKRLLLVAIAIAIGTFAISCSQKGDAPSKPDSTSDSQPRNQLGLSLGPIEGLTTGWHTLATLRGTHDDEEDGDDVAQYGFRSVNGEIADVLPIPLGSEVLLRCSLFPGQQITWQGADEVDRSDSYSIASCIMGERGPQQVKVSASAQGELRSYSCNFEVLEVAIQDIRVTKVAIIDPSPVGELATSNEETMEIFFGKTLGRLSRVSSDHYAVPKHKQISLLVESEPAEIAHLMEWRIDGAPAHLMSKVSRTFDQPGNYLISVGPPALHKEVRLTAFETTITSHKETVDHIPDGELVTFRAKTNPPGYEQEIAWISSTKFGTATPIFGQGPEFSVLFKNTTEPYQWLGVKANFEKLAQDAKPPVMVTSCSPDSGGTGTLITITGSGFGASPDDLCIRLMPDGNVAARVLTTNGTTLTAMVTAVPDSAQIGNWKVQRGEGSSGPIPGTANITGVSDAWAWEGTGEAQNFATCNTPFTPKSSQTDTVIKFSTTFIGEEFLLAAGLDNSYCGGIGNIPAGTCIWVDAHFNRSCPAAPGPPVHVDCFAGPLVLTNNVVRPQLVAEIAQLLQQCFDERGVTGVSVQSSDPLILVRDTEPGCSMDAGGGGTIEIRCSW